MPLEVGGDERTHGNEAQAARSHVLQRAGDQPPSEALALELRRDLGVDEDARSRLGELRLTLDQCWDLLRQRRALAESGLDADAARVRPPETIERYDQ